jgi:GNAT superfamily N-acetyltransferase
MNISNDIRLRHGAVDDLNAVNTLIEAAIMTWDLPERVKRLALPSYRYQAHDLAYLTVIIAESLIGDILGVAACEPADSADTPTDCQALLLHGIYVDPAQHRKGIGSRLLAGAIQAGRQGGFDALLVKANKNAQNFFLAQGLTPLTVTHSGRDYPYRFWLDFKATRV